MKKIVKSLICKKCRMWTEHEISGIKNPKRRCKRCKTITYLMDEVPNRHLNTITN